MLTSETATGNQSPVATEEFIRNALIEQMKQGSDYKFTPNAKSMQFLASLVSDPNITPMTKQLAEAALIEKVISVFDIKYEEITEEEFKKATEQDDTFHESTGPGDLG